MQIEILKKYFPDLSPKQEQQFEALPALYTEWNEKINVISRKDIESLMQHHVLHSLGIAKVISFIKGTSVLDVGTGGGFPGIPLAILFPEVRFHLTDSIGKKIKVVQEVSAALALKNVEADHIRSETLDRKYDFVVCRAVAPFSEILQWTKNKIIRNGKNALPNGILCLKGGDLSAELSGFEKQINIYSLNKFFEEEFFETKQVVYWSAQ